MRLGYIGGGAVEAGLAYSFNEAEAHAPRIQVNCYDLVKNCWKSFNEAEAHAPRIPPRRCFRTGRFRIASMRPRRMRLGYLAWRPGVRGLGEASMRPRRMRLGYLSNSECPPWRVAALQ